MIKKLTLQVRLGTSFRVACAVLGIVLVSSGAPLTEREALDRLSIWINGHPVMGCLAGNAIASTVRFQEGGGSYSVYAVAFSPVGYVVLNSDDRLPLVVAFSASSGVNLADLPDNAFRAALLTHVANAAETLGGMDTALAPDLSYRRAAPRRTPLSIEQYGPYLATTWNQCNPYNLLCPEDPGGSAYYGYRVPSGC
ncbi:MAG TPA: Spi family protease inhibitor, partial [Kiritimatiellia bacterium]|nr:Spi family protease inhibitor [Kiritimatiellia bacterium]